MLIVKQNTYPNVDLKPGDDMGINVIIYTKYLVQK